MARAGIRDQTIIPGEIVLKIHERSQGIPRLINAICDNLLLTAFAMECKTASLEMLNEVTADMRIDHREKPSIPHKNLYGKESRPLQRSVSYRSE